MPAPQVITIPYKPRDLQRGLHKQLDTHRFGVTVAHRRFGKTVLAINQLIKCALTLNKERPRLAYIAPTYSQGKAVAFDYIQYYSRPVPGVTFNQSELRADYPNGGQVRIFGADSPDSLRGIYLDGAVLDEFGLMPPRIFSEVIRPALSDRGGWAFFIGTPAGKNQFYDIVQHAKSQPDWFFEEFKASETGIIAEHELVSARKDMTSDEYAQEYECSFEASVKGAIFSAEISSARATGRIGTVPVDPILPVDTDWDLGVGDSTAIWFSQSSRSGEVRVVDYYEASGEGLPHYRQVLSDKGYTYGVHTAPHDIQVKELGSGRSRLETAQSLGIRFGVAPNIPIEDGIHAARMLLPRCWFDATRCAKGLEALQHYRRDYNSRLNEFKAVPVHDWACFTADTEVLTRNGTCRIMELPIDGEVLTPCGWKQYQGPKITRRSAQLVAVALSDGSTVRCTPDHLWLTASGWQSAALLQPTTVIQSCSIHSFNISTGGSIDSGRVNAISLAVVRDYIGTYGAQPLVRFLRDAISITAMRTQPTTGLATWNVCLPATTVSDSTLRRISAASPPKDEPLRRSGIGLTRVGSGIDGWLSAPRVGASGVGKIGHAFSVALWRRWWSVRAAFSRSIARLRVKPLRIVSVTPLTECEDTCCIHVPDVECFTLANGAVVHNSHGADAFRYLAVRQQPPKEKPKDTWPRESYIQNETAWMS